MCVFTVQTLPFSTPFPMPEPTTMPSSSSHTVSYVHNYGYLIGFVCESACFSNQVQYYLVKLFCIYKLNGKLMCAGLHEDDIGRHKCVTLPLHQVRNQDIISKYLSTCLGVVPHIQYHCSCSIQFEMFERL